MKSILIFLTFLLPMFHATESPQEEATNRCSPPQNLTKVNQTNNSVSYDWADGFGSTLYKVYYEKNGAPSAVFTTTNSEYTFDNLSSGSYQFYFFTECEAGQYSIIVEDHVDM